MNRTFSVPVARNSPSNIEIRYQYALHFREFDEEQMYFIDESGFSIHAQRSYERALGPKDSSENQDEKLFPLSAKS